MLVYFLHGLCTFSNIVIPLQSPIFGYLWGGPILWFRVPSGYPFRGVVYGSIPIPWYLGMKTPYHILVFPIPCHLIPYHWNHRGIPHSKQVIPSFQRCHWVSGVFFFLQIWNYFCRLQYRSIGPHLLWTGSWGFSWCFKLQVEAIQWTPSFENQSNWAYSRVFCG